MARRGFTVIFTLLGFALFVSMAGFLLLYLLVGREPAVPSNATLVLKVGGDLAEVAPADVVGYLRGATHADRPRRSSTTCARPRSTRASSPCCSSRPASTRRTGARCRRFATRCSTSGSPASRSTPTSSTAATASTTWRRAADKCLPDAVEPARSDRRRDLRGVPARHARQDRRVSRPASHRRLQDGVEPAHREGLHARRTARWTSRSTAICTSRSCAASPTAGRRREAEVRALDRRGPVPARRRARAPAWSTTWRTRIRSTSELRQPRPGDATRRIDGDDYARVSAASLGLNRGPRIARDLRHRHDHQRQERLRPAQRRRRRLRHAHRVHPPGPQATRRCARSCCASTAPAGRRRRPTRSGAS